MRDITALAFSEDGETLRCTTSTGDFVGVDLRSKQVTLSGYVDFGEQSPTGLRQI